MLDMLENSIIDRFDAHMARQYSLYKFEELLGAHGALEKPLAGPYTPTFGCRGVSHAKQPTSDRALCRLLQRSVPTGRFPDFSEDPVEKWLTRGKTPHPQTLINEQDEPELTSRNPASYVCVLCRRGGSV